MDKLVGTYFDSEDSLRYRISDISQLPQCKSNNSRDLSIKVEQLLNNPILNGTKVSVCHTDFGVLFSTVLDASGNMVDSKVGGIQNMSWDIIKQELAKYGFVVDYRPEEKLSKAQIEYLKTLNNLRFDKIRFISVYHVDKNSSETRTELVAFNVASNPMWLHNTYNPSYTEYIQAISSGTAMCLSNISETQGFSWTWLWNKVLSITDILDSQGENL